MRTKTLLLAAALTAAGIASSLAQSNVYSINVVGYVNVVVSNGYSLIANPLNAATNTVTALFQANSGPGGAALGNFVYTWNGVGFIGIQNDEFGAGWGNPTLDLAPGKGFFIRNPGAAYTNTFVGEVLQGSLNNTPVVGYSVIASKVPQKGFTLDLGLVPGAGDTIYRWNGLGFIGINFDEFGSGWAQNTPFVVDATKGPQIDVAQSFFYRKLPASTATWVRNFTVQ